MIERGAPGKYDMDGYSRLHNRGGGVSIKLLFHVYHKA